MEKLNWTNSKFTKTRNMILDNHVFYVLCLPLYDFQLKN